MYVYVCVYTAFESKLKKLHISDQHISAYIKTSFVSEALLVYTSIYIGHSSASRGYFSGYLDEIRISKIAVYTGNFVKPSAPFDHCIETPTSSPTATTQAPTKAPTASPTLSPSGSPSASPSRSPSASPTVPTDAPTGSPTASPTTSPSPPPTISPTASPTRYECRSASDKPNLCDCEEDAECESGDCDNELGNLLLSDLDISALSSSSVHSWCPTNGNLINLIEPSRPSLCFGSRSFGETTYPSSDTLAIWTLFVECLFQSD